MAWQLNYDTEKQADQVKIHFGALQCPAGTLTRTTYTRLSVH